VCGDVGRWVMAMVPGDGGIAWSWSEAEAVDRVGNGISMGSTCIGDSGQYCGAGAGGNGTATGGATGATWGMGTAGVARDASGGIGGRKNVGGS
jgi:hypothetical protein